MSEAPLSENDEDALEESLSERAYEYALPAEKILKQSTFSRDDLHALLDIAINLQELALKSGGLRVGAVSLKAMEVGNALVRTTFSWLNEALRSPTAHNEPLSRSEIAFSLAVFPSTLPPHEREVLSSALRSLDGGTGELPEFLKPESKSGRGPNPGAAHFAEKRMWYWIAIQTGQGIPSHIAEQQVAASVGLSINAVRAWRAAWVKRESKDRVVAALDHMRKAGAQGTTTDFPSLLEIASEWRQHKGLPDRKSPSA